MIRRMATSCCCSGLLLVILVVAYVTYREEIAPFRAGQSSMSNYVRDYQDAIAAYTKRVDEIEHDPELKRALTSAQEHAEHLRQMKQVVEAEQACEDKLARIKAPPELKQFHDATLEFFHEQAEKYRNFYNRLGQKDVASISDSLKKIDEQSHSTAKKVDNALSSVPHFQEGKREIADLWAQLKQKLQQ